MLWRMLLAISFIAATAAPAMAHHATGGPTTGIPIAAISHGDMLVYQQHFGAIIHAAERQAQPEDGFRRVLNYARIEKAYCAWGLMPGAVSDEDSPFNECSHAYLAAAKALLADLREGPDQPADVVALGNAVDLDLVLSGGGPSCGFSGEGFNTADIIRPRWADVPGHPPTLAIFAGLATVIGAAVLLLAAAFRRNGGKPPTRPPRIEDVA